VRRLRDAEGERVLSRATAEQLGTLRHVVVDLASRRIVALHVGGRRKRAQFVDWERIVGFGPDAIVVEGDDALRGPAGDDEVAVGSGKRPVVGQLALSDRGDGMGPVRDLEFDEGSGALLGVVTEDGTLAAERLRAIGSYCVILRTETPVRELPASTGGPAA
jgi:uncharacterized protein YrrD